MIAAVVDSWGATPVVREVPEPTRGAGEALVRVLAAGMNPVDVFIASGRFYGDGPEPPYVAGAELVGEVVESERLPSGTRVWSLGTGGAFAEVAAVPEASLVPVPDGLSPERAVAAGIAGLAGWMSVLERGAMRPGETVVVLGASGVVGQVAVQAARRHGAGRIVAVARSAEGLGRAAALGADVAVPIDDGDLVDALAAACDGTADLVVDVVWGAPAAAAIRVLGRGGRLVQAGNAGAPLAEIPAGPLRGGRLEIRGFALFTEDRGDVERCYGELAPLVGDGRVRIDVEAVPLAEAPIAWERQVAGAAGRKLVLVT